MLPFLSPGLLNCSGLTRVFLLPLPLSGLSPTQRLTVSINKDYNHPSSYSWLPWEQSPNFSPWPYEAPHDLPSDGHTPSLSLLPNTLPSFCSSNRADTFLPKAFMLTVPHTWILSFLTFACLVPSWHSVLNFTMTSSGWLLQYLKWPVSLWPHHLTSVLCLTHQKPLDNFFFIIFVFFISRKIMESHWLQRTWHFALKLEGIKKKQNCWKSIHIDWHVIFLPPVTLVWENGKDLLTFFRAAYWVLLLYYMQQAKFSLCLHIPNPHVMCTY